MKTEPERLIFVYDNVDVTILDFAVGNVNDYIGAHLVRVVCKLKELMRDEKFAHHYENIETNRQVKFFGFETSKGIFYIRASVWNNQSEQI